MKRYVVNMLNDESGNHEVHVNNCPHLPSYDHQMNLGYHDSCRGAVAKAKETYPTANGCYYCSRSCHTS